MVRRVVPFALLAAVGCSPSGGGTIAPPSYDADALTKKCFDQYDANKDGSLAGAELDACPSLKAALPFIDLNKDKKLGGDELTKRFKMYQDNRAGAIGVGVRVVLGEEPVEGATVTFTPEDFLKDVIKGGTGKTNKAGGASIVGDTGPGLAAGLYRVTITKGSEIPARYNTNTTLGREVAAGGGRESAGNNFEFALQSR